VLCGDSKIKVLNLPPAATSGYLAAILVLCKSFGAVVYGIVVAPLVRYGSIKLQHRIAVTFVAIALAFPVLRITNVFPTKTLAGIFANFSQERADSLQYRFDNEDKLLAHASQRFWFGWGRFGRNRVYDEQGDDRSVTDGRWIITMGQFGFVGFLAEFLLLTLPVFLAMSASRFALKTQNGLLLAALSLIVAIWCGSIAKCLRWLLALANNRCSAGRAEQMKAFGRSKNQGLTKSRAIWSASDLQPS